MQNNKNQELEELKAALEAAEQRFRTFLRLSSEFYWETDAHHRLAAPRDPMLEAAWQAHRGVLEAQLPFRGLEFAQRQADGQLRHYILGGEPVLDGAGAFRGYRGVGREITEHNYRYHVLDAATIPDAEFDKLMRELERLEAAHPELVTSDSTTQRVGGTPIGTLEVVVHRVPMLSLNNAYSDEEVEAFAARVAA